MTRNNLKSVFQTVGEQYGYAAEAEFAPLADIKVIWQRTYGEARFKVCDYLSDAPDEVLSDLATNIFKRIAGQITDYPPRLRAWLMRPEFIEDHRGDFIDRARSHAETDPDMCARLTASLRRLTDMGLLPSDHNILAFWTEEGYSGRFARSSIYFKTVFVSDEAEDLTDDLLDYAVYCEVARILCCDPSDTDGGKYRSLIDAYPDADLISGRLRHIIEAIDEGEA